jgi:hypothetical protein
MLDGDHRGVLVFQQLHEFWAIAIQARGSAKATRIRASMCGATIAPTYGLPCTIMVPHKTGGYMA